MWKGCFPSKLTFLFYHCCFGVDVFPRTFAIRRSLCLLVPFSSSCSPAKALEQPRVAAATLNFVDFVKVKKKTSLSLEFLLTYIIT